MTDRSRKYLSDILAAIGLVEEFLSGINDFRFYQRDQKTKSAIERQPGIIGEAINKYRKEGNPGLPKSQQIVNFRNRLIHAYDSVDDSIVWAIIKNHLPPLKAEVEELIKQL
jgi:uncharacterized protein with HEPN domain